MRIAATHKTRLFSAESLIDDSELWLTAEQANYVSRVLRLKTDDHVILFDGQGGEFSAVIKEFAKDRVRLQLGRRRANDIESPLSIQLVQGLSRGGRMDVVVQKSTELGVHRITPVISEFSVVKLDPEKAAKRREHWLKVSQSACEQCGRNRLPEIDVPQNLHSWLANPADEDRVRIMLDPGSGESIAKLAPAVNAVTLLVGPEGGLSDSERQQCEEKGFRSMSLGPRILRTETAALAAIAVLQAYRGDLG
jgi:16S rRNA (uracil1498-N3)-methyltransferase